MSGSVDCPHQGRWFGGCRFEARYDRVGRCERFDGALEGRGVVTGYFEARRPRKTYVRDVCVRCGQTIERQP